MTYFVQTLVYIRTVHILKLKLSTLKLRLAYLCGSGRNDSFLLQNYAIVKKENSAKSTSLELAYIALYPTSLWLTRPKWPTKQHPILHLSLSTLCVADSRLPMLAG
jgi:hypothetical protein